MKKLLHIGCNVGTESMPKYFREVCDYDEIKPDRNLPSNLTAYMMNKPTPDIVFLQIQSNTIDGQNTSFIGDQIRMLRDNGAHVINWTGDLRNTTPQWMIEFSHNVSITMFSNMRDVEYCKSKGINTGFLQQGIDTNIFTPEGEAAYRRQVAQTLQNHFKNRFKLYGNGWPNAGNVNHSQYEEAKVYRGAKIAISVSHYDVDKEHLDVFADMNQLIQKCEYYLEHEDERRQIANTGREYANKEFSYQNIIKQILQK
jgi:hypothetical protein